MVATLIACCSACFSPYLIETPITVSNTLRYLLSVLLLMTAQSLQTLRKASIFRTDPYKGLCYWHDLVLQGGWILSYEAMYLYLSWSCRRVISLFSRGYFTDSILISYLVVRSPLGRNWGWKGNTTETSWPADKRQKENLLSWKQATTPHWFNKANSPDSISFSADMKTYWGLCSLSRSHKENLYEDRQNFPHAYSNSLWNLRGQNPTKQTPETQKWNSFPQRKHVRKKKKVPLFLLGKSFCKPWVFELDANLNKCV